ncbi:MAG: hypothetical protein WB952_05785 [Terriglobales bacterium]
MTLPTSPEINPGGPYYAADVPVNTDPASSPGPEQTVPQSPSGAISDEAPTFNFDAGITSTENYLANELLVDDAPQGQLAISSDAGQPVIAGTLPGSLVVNNFYGGVVGVPGNKFS